MQLSVVVPVLNEAGNIEPLLAELQSALDGGYDFEVLYVDDGSRDATASELESARRRHPWLRVVKHRRTCGQSAALRTGVMAARGRWIATLDGDGQNDPCDIPRLLDVAADMAAAGQPVLVAGYRMQRRDNILKRVSSQVANAVRSRLLGDATPDTGCGLKVFARADFLTLPYFDHMHRFLPALIRRAGGRVTSVEVNHRQRQRGRSKYGTLDRLLVGVVDLLGVMWLQRRACLAESTESGDALE
ncbi:MAG: glycosyltransferase family 2 protein, partial [Chromatiaceae bacterium]|jgi:dolichol-phosphate mannosyltransferase